MLGATRGLIFALMCSVTLAGGCVRSATADEALDTTRLPRVAGAKEIFAYSASTIFTTTDPVGQTADAIAQGLVDLGWQRYVAPFTAYTQNPTMQIMSFKKGPQGLSVFVTLAAAQAGATSVTYNALALVNDLPIPKDASRIEFDPNRPHLNCITADGIDRTLTFFRAALTSAGWSQWSMKDGAKLPDSAAPGEKTEKGAFAYYVRDGKKPLLLVLQRIDNGGTKVELKAVPAESLIAESQKPKVAEAAPKAVVKTERIEPAKSEVDPLADEIRKQAMEIVRQATGEALRGVKTPPSRIAQADEAPLSPMTNNDAPIPMPDTADGVDFDGADGKLEFNSASSVKALAAFYRSAMKPLGWQERTSVINRPNMVVLDFAKSGKKLSFTIMQMGPKVNVTANGSGLVVASAKPKTQDADAPAADVQPANEVLEAEDTRGLPVPTRHTSSATESTPFRVASNANVPASLTAVLAFYRNELGKRGWKELADKAVVKTDQAVLLFSSPEGPGMLTLGRENNETTVKLAWRKQADAVKAGIAPKPGQVKIVFGNVMEVEASITINKKIIKVAAGVGTKGPDGPTMELPPGIYTYSSQSAGRAGKTDQVTVGADETWGLLVGPGGVLPLQMY